VIKFWLLLGAVLASFTLGFAEEALPPDPTKEADIQKALREEALKLEIEMARAEREGEEAVYKVRVERTKKLAEKANQTKSLSDVLIFEKVATQTIRCFREMTEDRVRREWPKMSALKRGNESMLESVERQVAYENEKLGGGSWTSPFGKSSPYAPHNRFKMV
jgi:hypothetical protein